MHVAVGSGNPVKVAATRRVLDAERVEAVPVESGVPEQPVGTEQTARGARNRAGRALAADVDPELGVGIEGGVAELDGADGLFLTMWAAVSDGNRTEVGAGPSLRLPAPIADRVRDGEELGPVMDDRLGREGVARDQGAAGVLTGGAIDRETALATAVAGAAGPFRTDHYGE
ncbi:inosine/xanthosine triphosphatase [Halobacteriales archaeon QS_8_69_26]|nr:MAG: inosine/xanthosine triphosphatase [Halobacteriales archaeon QS_8_69_26]